MVLFIYRGLDGEKVPEDVTHVDSSVTIIKRWAFECFEHLVSFIMVDNVKRIEAYALYNCYALRLLCPAIHSTFQDT